DGAQPRPGLGEQRGRRTRAQHGARRRQDRVMTRATQLTVAECRALLETGVVGRVAMATPVGPRISPVNYVVHEDAIVFRTAPYTELSTYGWSVDLAFEIDRLDPDARLGWSVVALGRAHVVDDPDDVQRIR